jgi:transcription termination factor Rho
MIDVKAYGGVDVRSLVSVMQLLLPLEKSSTFTDEIMLHPFYKISQELRAKVNKTQARVIDLCSGVGMSTRALEKVSPVILH